MSASVVLNSTACFVPQLLRSCVNVVLGALYDIAEETQQKTAAILNNIVLGLGAVTTVVNAIISAFDMSETVVPQ